MRRYLLVVAIVALVALLSGPFFAVPLAGQTPSSDAAQNENSKSDSTVPLLRVTTKEVLVDLIALDRHNRPVLDLKPDELQVVEGAEPESERAGRATEKRGRHPADDSIAPPSVDPITSLSVFDPNDPASSQRDTRNGFRILASCLERSAVHYLLAFHPGPSGWSSGYHSIAITTNRRDTKLFYRHHYYVGLAVPAPDSAPLNRTEVDQLLRRSACYYPVSPLSIALHARLIDTGRTDVVRYLVSVDASSLSFLTLDSDSTGRTSAGLDRRVALDYGACNFDESGKPASYFRAPLEQVLTSADYARALDRGFPHILEFPASEHIALTRVVLRDRATGNLGAADVKLSELEQIRTPEGSSATAQSTADLKRYSEMRDLYGSRDGHKAPRAYVPPPLGPIGSFGSIVPGPHSFCGDVYELPRPSDRLPDFRELDPIGAIYASSLNVPNQTFSNTSGIPGVTPRTNLFGIDYHASFRVQTPGEYHFELASDDGAILEIDDKRIINLDGLHQINEGSAAIRLEPGLHTIHVPYYQGAVDSVALQLWIKPPGANTWALFDLRDYQSPTAAPDIHQ